MMKIPIISKKIQEHKQKQEMMRELLKILMNPQETIQQMNKLGKATSQITQALMGKETE